MKWETQAGMPTKGILYDQIIEKGRELLELYLMMGHIHADDDIKLAKAWHKIAELQEQVLAQVNRLAQGKLN
jgi:hypothetical protein